MRKWGLDYRSKQPSLRGQNGSEITSPFWNHDSNSKWAGCANNVPVASSAAHHSQAVHPVTAASVRAQLLGLEGPPSPRPAVLQLACSLGEAVP